MSRVYDNTTDSL